MTDTKDTAPPTDAAAPDFAGLLSEATALDLAAAPPDPAAQQQAQQGEAAAAESRDMADAMEMVIAFVAPIAPERYVKAYDEAARARIAATWGPLAVKRGWSIGGMVGEWAPELAFMGALFLPAFPVVMADVKAKQEAASRQQRPQPQQPPQGAGS